MNAKKSNIRIKGETYARNTLRIHTRSVYHIRIDRNIYHIVDNYYNN